jgi:hypothetical protein
MSESEERSLSQLSLRTEASSSASLPHVLLERKNQRHENSFITIYSIHALFPFDMIFFMGIESGFWKRKKEKLGMLVNFK